MRRVGRWAVMLSALVTVGVVGGLPVYVLPQRDPLRHADAVVVLGGPGDDRYALGIELSRQGWAPVTYWSNPGANTQLTQFCNSAHDFDLHCFVPDTPTTKGEARGVRALATKYGWRTIIVVTFRPHISRARYIFEKCIDGDLIMVESPTQLSLAQWAFQYIYQTAGYVRAALQPGC